MSRRLDDDGLLRLLDQAWNPNDPLLIGFKQGRVRTSRATYGLTLGYIELGVAKPLATTPLFKEHTTSYILYPAHLNSFALLYGARFLHLGLLGYNPINYLLGNWGKTNADELDVAAAIEESYILLRKYMWTPKVKQLKSYKTDC